MVTILFVHQSADLYGSDKALLMLVERLDPQRFKPIVLLPVAGPLFDELIARGIETHILPLVKLSRSMMGIKGLLSLPGHYIQSMRMITRLLAGRHIDIVHSNTLAILSGAFWAHRQKLPHVWHVHEIVLSPRAVNHLFAWLLHRYAKQIVCNSNATLHFIAQFRGDLPRKATVIWNGLPRPEIVPQPQITAFRNRFCLETDDILVALVGRFNRWKGHHVLIEAATLLHSRLHNKVHYLLVGNAVAGQEHYETAMREHIHNVSADKYIHLVPFQTDIQLVWQACDIAVVPSIEPEAFGLTALEAMAAGKPVIGTSHGGIIDVVRNGRTGFLVPPNAPKPLAVALECLIDSLKLRNKMGRAGKARAAIKFNVENYTRGFEQIYASLGNRYD